MSSLPMFCRIALYFSLYVSVYNVKEHRDYRNGKKTEKQVLEDFLKSFDSPNDPDGKVGVVFSPSERVNNMTCLAGN